MDKREHEQFINRELSWLEFNQRVLEEAKDKTNPLLERVKFISIASSNLDEFFMVRVASLLEQVEAGFQKTDFSGLTPEQQIEKILSRTHDMVDDQYKSLKELKKLLTEEKINILDERSLSHQQKEYLRTYFYNTIYPVLTPMVVDSSRPFPLILNKSLNIALFLEENDGDAIFGTIQVPSVLGRIVELPTNTDSEYFILLEDIIKMHLQDIFTGHKILSMSCYRITRNADLSIDEEGAEDLLEAIEQSVKRRKWGAAIRIEIETGMDKALLSILKEELELNDDAIYEINGPIDLTFLMKLGGIKGFDKLRYTQFNPCPVPEFEGGENMFSVISRKDVLVHHPYESFDCVVDMVKRAAKDPQVLAIKQTLYRVSGNSPIVRALMEAAENGKQVTVLVELKARFDEENNIIWAKKLEQAGCHVIYGLVGLKTHGKILLVVRKEEDGIKRYVHLGTGNYNDVTANIYTDLGLFTSNNQIGADASALFNMLSGYSQIHKMHKLYIAPIFLRKKFLALIKNEEENAKKGRKALIIAKVNSLVDEEIIKALYDASAAGVRIELIVRGICCLRPGIKGVSENISVKSIVGRFLEHSRVYYFYNDGEENIYLSSADWMGRNLDKRVEILFPVEDETNRKTVKHILDAHLKDNAKARVLKNDGTYEKVEKRDNEESLNSQKYFERKAEKRIKKIKKEHRNEAAFTPIRH